MKEQLITPKVTIIIYKDGKKTYRYPSIRKAKYFSSTEAKVMQDKGIPMGLRVEYGKATTAYGKIDMFDNEMTTTSQKEFKQALKAFLEKDLWLRG